jgi:hypothetical protein
MMKHLVAILALTATLATGALAQTAPAAPPAAATAPPAAAAPAAMPSDSQPTTAEQCLKAAFSLAEKAEAKKLSNEDFDKLEEMLTKMETHCDAKQYGEAHAMAQEIEQTIATKQ